ncbi:MAG: ABC transporter ATP-binding protein [Bdellovibrionaceae bacterium]|nr:ABC transporter ATP-binding protein [Pseudobdellovibrionaceae bacterium]
MSAIENAIEVKNLNKSFRKSVFEKSKHILKNVSFDIPKNKTTGFVGNNGSGKTTSIKCIFEFIFKDSGDVKFFNQEMGPAVRRRIGYLPERPYLYEFLTAEEFLKFHLSLSGIHLQGAALNALIDETLHKVGLLEAKKKALRSFSKGMLQRAGLAQALIHKPEILILDEPMSGLDPDGRLMVKDILREEKKKGITIFFSSHLLQDMEELCDHLVAIHGGEIIYNSDLKSFMSQFPSLEEAFRSKQKEVQK